MLIGLVGLGTAACSSGTAAPQQAAKTETAVALRPQQPPPKPPSIQTKVAEDPLPDPPKPPPENPPEETPTNPRTIPPNTPSEHARNFRRLPVSVHDGPPIGGIGKTGIHIDRVWLGNKYGRRGCSGIADNFPTAKQQVNVCFRVVHHRQAEQVNVLWEQEGDITKRRRGVQIPAQHAYRSRAYLALRQEYIGRWTVRIFSEDEVELAATTFTVGPATTP
ncbi:MAG: hypothetical protein ACPG4T_22375 [Nannocystaceae bacterium]